MLKRLNRKLGDLNNSNQVLAVSNHFRPGTVVYSGSRYVRKSPVTLGYSTDISFLH